MAQGVDLSAFKDEYPFTSHYLEVGGHRLHYIDEGPRDGEVLLCVHGNPTWSFYWRRLVRAFSATHRVIALDHIGCGLSDVPSPEDYSYRLAERVSDLGALVDALGLERLTLVVHDWGGMIGLAWAVEHPEVVERYIITNTAGFGLPAGRPLPWQLKVARNLPFSRFLMEDLNLFVRGAARMCAMEPMSPAVRAGFLAPYQHAADRVAVHRFVQDIPLDPAHPSFPIVDGVSRRLETLQDRPALVLWGERDFVFDGHFLDEWRRRWPGAEFHAFPKAGHYVLEDAHGEMLPLIRDFLSRTPASEVP